MNNLSLKNFTVNIEREDRIKDVNINIASGELVLVLGPNGSGKSSLLKGIMSIEETKLSGDILLGDLNITNQKTDEKARAGILYSPQQAPILEGVKLISLLYGAYTKMSATDTPMNIIELHKHAVGLAMEYGLDQTLLDRPFGVGLSGGEKKQCELLQILVLKPKFVLLDEIDSGVDVDMVKKITIILEAIKKSGTGILLISHNISLLQSINPTKIYLVKNGKIEKEGDASIISDIEKNGF